MSITDESENLLEHLTERINPNGWRVISNPSRQPDPNANRFKTLIQTMQERRPTRKRKVEETEPPEAA